MGLQKEITTNSGIHLPAAYIKVGLIMTDYINNIARVRVITYADQQARLDNRVPVDFKELTLNSPSRSDVDTEKFNEHFSPNAVSGQDNNPVKQAYIYLKTLPEYQDAADAL